MGREKNSVKSRGYVEREEVKVKPPKKKRRNPVKRAFGAVKARVLSMRIYQRVLCCVMAFVFLCGAVIGVAFLRDGIATAALLNTASIDNDDYSTKASCVGVQAVQKEISHSYAAIEMFALYMGEEEITEESLAEKYGAKELSGDGFADAITEQFDSYKATAHKNTTASEMLSLIYKQLKKGFPVPVELATKSESGWIKNFAVVYAVTAEDGEIMVSLANTLGNKETIYLSEFLGRTSYRAYDGMPAAYALGLAFGVYSRNVVFEIARVTK